MIITVWEATCAIQAENPGLKSELDGLDGRDGRDSGAPEMFQASLQQENLVLTNVLIKVELRP